MFLSSQLTDQTQRRLQCTLLLCLGVKNIKISLHSLAEGTGGLGWGLKNYVLRRLSLLPLIRPWKQFLLSLGSVDFWWDKRSLMNYLERELPLPDTVLIPGNTITSRNTRSQMYQLWPYLYVHSPANKTIIISVAPFFPSLTKFQNCSDKLVLVGFNMDDDKDLIKSERAVISMNELTNTNRQNWLTSMILEHTPFDVISLKSFIFIVDVLKKEKK